MTGIHFKSVYAIKGGEKREKQNSPSINREELHEVGGESFDSFPVLGRIQSTGDSQEGCAEVPFS